MKKDNVKSNHSKRNILEMIAFFYLITYVYAILSKD